MKFRYLIPLIFIFSCSEKNAILDNFDLVASEYHTNTFDFIKNARRYDSDDSTLFTIGRQRNTVYKIALDFSVQDSIFSSGEGPGEFIRTENISVSKHKVWVMDSSKRSIEIFDKNLKYLETFVLDEPVATIAAKNDSVIYASQLLVDEWRILQSDATGFSELHSARIKKDLSSGYADLKTTGDYLVVMRIMTNEALVIHMESGKKYHIINPFIPDAPEFKNAMGTRLPLSTVWVDGFVHKEHFYMTVRNDESVMTVYRSPLGSNFWSVATIEEKINGLMYLNDKLYGFTPTGYYIYELN